MRKPYKDHQGRQGRRSLIARIFIVIGVLAVVYLFVTEVLMRILALLTVS